MTERELRDLIAAVKAGDISRRTFVRRIVGLGLTAPFATTLLSHAGLAQAAAKFDYKPTKAGGGGALKTLYWQAATLLNPHFAIGTKDQEGSRIFYEPLAGWDNDGNLVPILAAEIPETENGGISQDSTVVTWKLKKDVQWHDGKPFTADDVVFNWEYAADPATAANTITPGTCRSRTRFSCGSKTTARRAVGRRFSRAAISSISRSTTPIPGPRSTASVPAPRPSIRCSAILRCGKRWRCSLTATPSRSTSMGGPASQPAISSTTRRNSSRRTRAGNSISRRPTSCWSRRAGSADRTASAPRTASSSSWFTRPRSTRRGRRPRRSSSRPAKRQGSMSS